MVLALVVGTVTGDTSGARLVFHIAIGFAVLGAYCFVLVKVLGRPSKPCAYRPVST